MARLKMRDRMQPDGSRRRGVVCLLCVYVCSGESGQWAARQAEGTQFLSIGAACRELSKIPATQSAVVVVDACPTHVMHLPNVLCCAMLCHGCVARCAGG